ncbi:uncharacterized protein RHOBADRAFT_40724 [Rhodotorula graminis WP1]|uniref:SET domain-containing protein n=1 Tax=Rhodotorula graminis (strain WP1) TaxID=578459 RepID=A0A194SCK7_RHOGW|nr:uncharacterized protein RHOBADRAFT_40724 [Rhodotorula graminis WP1]KPV78180.1 hypothetical protein RHOBADRAFT_40724 [Rhodotorula graminis WP1]
MSAPDLEVFFNMALSLGMPADEVDRLRRNPEQLRSVITARGGLPQGPSLRPSKDPDEWAALYKQNIEAARAQFDLERARPQRYPPAADRLSTIAKTEHMRSEQAKMEVQDDTQILWNFVGVGKHASSTPLDQLKPIRFKDMMVTKMHAGRFLLCRIVSSPIKVVGLTCVVEDQDGRVDMLAIYNVSLHGMVTGPDLDLLFPRGTILAIRESTYKPNATGTCYVVRIETPTDYEVLSPQHPLVKGARWATSSLATPRSASFDYKALGNRYFAAKKDLLAVKAYSDGLDSTDDAATRLVLFLNRAQAHLRLGSFASALRDTSAVLGFLSSEVPGPALAELKATLRRARALEGLRQLEKAREAFARVVELDPTSAEGRECVQRVERMLRESATGEYDWRQIVKDSDEGVDEKELSLGDYVGPVKVVEIKGRGGGRGIVATRDIKAGELLLEAFATGEATKGRLVMGYDLTRNMASRASKMALVEACAAKVQDDPSAAALLYALHGGEKAEPVGAAVLGAQQDRELDSSSQPAFADIARIEGICLVNAFSLRRTNMCDDDAGHDLVEDGGSALFLGGSLFNHSCTPNASWTLYGDVQVVRARAPVKAGDEVFAAYVPASSAPEKRDSLFKLHFPNGCTCAYCVDERRDTPQQVARRAELLRAIEQLEGTYSRRQQSSYRHALVGPYHICAHVLSHPHLPNSNRLANVYELKAISASGADVRETPDGGERVEVVSAPYTVPAERSLAERSLLKIAGRTSDAEAPKWIKAASDVARITHGVDWDGFVERADEDLENFDLKRLVARLSSAEA